MPVAKLVRTPVLTRGLTPLSVCCSHTAAVPGEIEALCKNHDEVTKAYGCLGVLCINQGEIGHAHEGHSALGLDHLEHGAFLAHFTVSTWLLQPRG